MLVWPGCPDRWREFPGRVVLFLVVSWLVFREVGLLAAQDPAPAPVMRAHRIVVPLPVMGSVDRDVRLAVTGVLERFDKELEAGDDDRRPLLVLEFRPRAGAAGENTEFERALALARFLAGDALRQVRTVAYLPVTVKGHSLLPVLGCQQIIMAPDAQLGAAGIAEDHVAAEVRLLYEEFAGRRRVLPPAVVLGMLDRELTVFEVKTADGPRYVLEAEREQLQRDGLAMETRTVIPAGDFGLLTGRQLRLELGFVSHLVKNDTELAEALEIPVKALDEDPLLGADPQPIRINLAGLINRQTVARIKREIRDQQENHDVNFICLLVNSPGGSLSASIDLANYLKELDASQVKTVAFVQQQALGDAALVALACDDMVMSAGSRLGGPGDNQPRQDELKNLEETLQPIADARGISWSVLKALVDHDLMICSYRNRQTGEVRYFCDVEHAGLEDQEQWVRQQEVKFADGLSASKADEIGISRKTVRDLAEFQALYQLPDQLDVAESPRLNQVLDRLVAQPWFASTLLFFAFLFLVSEVSAPGLGVPGFLSGVCFLLFFWAHFFNGTAGWLEVLLFGMGIICVALEVFVVPGLGVFGIGGGLMIVLSIIMASQTFVIPRNSYQMEMFGWSLFRFVVASSAVGLFLWGLLRFFPNNFLFRQVVLPALSPEERAEQDRREALVAWDYLVGETGMTATALVPAGKIRLGHKLFDVVSEGDMVEKGVPVSVVEVRGNRVVVRPVEPS